MNVCMPKPLPPEVESCQDAYLQEEARLRGRVDLEQIPTVKQALGSSHGWAEKLCLWQGDISRLAVGAIVNAANSQMLGCFIPGHHCIDNCIHSFAGVQLRLECHRQMEEARKKYGRQYEQPTALPMLTPAYNLPADSVIHVTGPIVYGDLTASLEAELADCYTRTLDMCLQHGIRSLAFCCISTGVFRFPGGRAAQIAIKSVSDWMDVHGEHMDRIVFNVYLDKDKEYYEEILSR